MWLKIIMILISLFMIYHLFYDVKIWSNGGPLIEGNENMRLPSAETLRIMFDRYDTDGSGTIERSEISKIFRDFGEDLTSNEEPAILALIDSDSNEKINFEEFMNWILIYERNQRQLGLRGAAGKEPPTTSAAEEDDEEKQHEDDTDISQDLGQEEQSESTNHSHAGEPGQISGTVSVDYCDVIDESTTDDVLAHKNLIPDDIDINVYNKSQVIRVGNNFIEILKGIRNLHNVPTMKESDLETLGASVINLKQKNSDNILKNKIIQNVCSMISGVHSNSVDWDTPKLEIKQITTGMFDDNGNTKFNQGDKATENSTKLEEQGLCLWKGCQKGLGQPTDSVWSLY